jgi:hypothetical protein
MILFLIKTYQLFFKIVELNPDVKLREKVKIDDFFIYECEVSESESEDYTENIYSSQINKKDITGKFSLNEEYEDFHSNNFQINYLQDTMPQAPSNEIFKLPQFIPQHIKQNFNLLLQTYPFLWNRSFNNTAPIDLSLFPHAPFGNQSIFNYTDNKSDILKNNNIQNLCGEKKLINDDINYNKKNTLNEKSEKNENEIIQEPEIIHEKHEDIFFNQHESKCLEGSEVKDIKEGSIAEKNEESTNNLNSGLLTSNKLEINNDIPPSNRENINFSSYLNPSNRGLKLKRPLTKPCILCGEAHYEKYEILKFITVSEFLNTIKNYLDQRANLDSDIKVRILAQEFRIPNYSHNAENYQKNKAQWEEVLVSFNKGEFKQENTFKRTKRFCKRCIYLKMEEANGMDTLLDAIHEEDEQAVLDIKKKEEIIRNIKEFFSASKEKTFVRGGAKEKGRFCPQEENHYQDSYNLNNKKIKNSDELNAFNIFDNIFGRKKLSEADIKMISEKVLNKSFSEKSEKNDNDDDNDNDDESLSDSGESKNQNQCENVKNVYESLIHQFGGNLDFMNDISQTALNNGDIFKNNNNLITKSSLENFNSYTNENMHTQLKNENSKHEETKFNNNLDNTSQPGRSRVSSNFDITNSQLVIEKPLSLNEIILLLYKINQQYNKSISFTQFQKLIIYTVFFMLDQYISQYQNIISLQTKSTKDILDYLENFNTMKNSGLSEESRPEVSEEQKRVILLHKIYSKSFEILNLMNDKISQMKAQCKFGNNLP